MNWIYFKDQLPPVDALILVYEEDPILCGNKCGEKHHYYICRFTIVEQLEEIATVCSKEPNFYQVLLDEVDYDGWPDKEKWVLIEDKLG